MIDRKDGMAVGFKCQLMVVPDCGYNFRRIPYEQANGQTYWKAPEDIDVGIAPDEDILNHTGPHACIRIDNVSYSP